MMLEQLELPFPLEKLKATFGQVSIDDITSVELEFIQNALYFDGDRNTIASVIASIKENCAQFWRLYGENAHGIVVTQDYFTGDGTQELYIWLLGGNNIAQYSQLISDTLERWARHIGCRTIRTVTQPRIAAMVKKKYGYHSYGEVLIKELDNGPRIKN